MWRDCTFQAFERGKAHGWGSSGWAGPGHRV